jgi:hypothetical protein
MKKNEIRRKPSPRIPVKPVVFERRASSPKAEFRLPVVFKRRAYQPKAELRSPVVFL